MQKKQKPKMKKQTFLLIALPRSNNYLVYYSFRLGIYKLKKKRVNS